jgi:hypothetical protein
MGQNAYFIEVGTPGGHSYIGDTCIECHMKTTPPPDVLSYNQGGSNHTFYAEREICGECHASDLSPDDVQDGIHFLLDMVHEMIQEEYLALLGELTDDGYRIDLNGDGFVVDAADVADVEFTETRGRQALTVTFVDSTVAGPNRIPDIDVQEWTGTEWVTVGPLNDSEFTDDDILKSGWNYLLVHNDGSVGIHNPFFANDLLAAARDAIIALDGAGAAVFASRRAESRSRPAIGLRRLSPEFEVRRSLRR